ncbi:MAG: hypothetical protein E3J35_00400 [Methanomassiliicoccales archaeon]|nr:MAG: hypothetical protein E3J35_00400 [Methanomassiliicoccales archaeon]
MFIPEVRTPSKIDKIGLREVLDFKEVRKLQECMQCGTCSASCPVAPIADFAQLIGLALGMKKDEIALDMNIVSTKPILERKQEAAT